MSDDLSDREERSYCYIDHANKQIEIYAANPYLSWLNQNRKERTKAKDAAAKPERQHTAAGPERETA